MLFSLQNEAAPNPTMTLQLVLFEVRFTMDSTVDYKA